MNTLTEKLFRGETVHVLVDWSGLRFSIVPGMDYGLRHYTTVVDGKVERSRVILSKNTVESWCDGLIKLPDVPYAVCISWKSENMPVPAFLSCHAECFHQWRARTSLPITEVHVTPLEEMAIDAECAYCGEAIATRCYSCEQVVGEDTVEMEGDRGEVLRVCEQCLK